MTRSARLVVLVAALALVAAAPAAAKPLNYKGKTKGGHSITFKREGKKVWHIYTMIPTVCLPTNRVGARSSTGAEIFNPPGPQIIGRKGTWEILQDAAMYYNPVTKHYEVTLNKSPKRNGRVSGKLHLTFSYIIPTYPMPSMITYACVGKTSFTAKAVKPRKKRG
jgi:hypothetical protein